MFMKNTKLLFLGFLLFGAVSCSSLDNDAKKAAKLSKKSIEYTTEMEFDKAEKAYKDSQDFFKKYENSGHLEEFLKAYNRYLIENN